MNTGLRSALLLGAITFVSLHVACQRTGKAFSIAAPGYVFSFPRDHASHPDYQTEWWYYTGHLKDKRGRSYGFQVTLFRHALTPAAPEIASAWTTNQVLFGHAALTDEQGQTFRYREVISRGSEIDDAGASTDVYRTWINSWIVQGLGRFHHLQAASDSLTISLVFEPRKKPVIHGIEGVSRKGPEASNASHYYSITRASVEGLLIDEHGGREVTGEAWLDREWSTRSLSKDREGWDWFSIQMENNEELMIYCLRRNDGSVDEYASGTFIAMDGSTTHLKNDDFRLQPTATWKSPTSGATYPSEWTLSVPSLELVLQIRPVVADQELRTEESSRITYWEGKTRVEGTRRGSAVKGNGYTELTGYAAPLNMVEK